MTIDYAKTIRRIVLDLLAILILVVMIGMIHRNIKQSIESLEEL